MRTGIVEQQKAATAPLIREVDILVKPPRQNRLMSRFAIPRLSRPRTDHSLLQKQKDKVHTDPPLVKLATVNADIHDHTEAHVDSARFVEVTRPKEIANYSAADAKTRACIRQEYFDINRELTWHRSQIRLGKHNWLPFCGQVISCAGSAADTMTKNEIKQTLNEMAHIDGKNSYKDYAEYRQCKEIKTAPGQPVVFPEGSTTPARR